MDRTSYQSHTKQPMVPNMPTMNNVRYSATPSAPHRSAFSDRANGAPGGSGAPLPFAALKSPTTLCFERMLGAGKYDPMICVFYSVISIL